MSQPLDEAGIPPEMFGQSKTVFYVEGNAAALLVSRTARGYRKRAMEFATAEAALTWCRKHLSGMVYLPADPHRN